MSFFFAFLLWWVKEIHHEESFITNLLLKLLASPWHVGKMNYCPILGQPKDKDTALLFLIVDWQDSTIRQHREWRKQEERLTAGSQRGWWGWREDPRSCYDFKPCFVPAIANNHMDNVLLLVLWLLANHGLHFSVWAKNNVKLHPRLFNSLRRDGI